MRARRETDKQTKGSRMDFGEKYGVDRRGTNCLKWDFGMQRKGRTDLLPMWVADMDFKLPEEIIAELRARIDHGAFGYTDPDQDYYDAINHWYSTHYGYTVEPEWVTVGAGIVYGLATGVHAFSEPGDALMVQQPVYYPFSEVIKNAGRTLINNQLHYEDGRYTIDFDDMERKIVENNVKVLLFCNPHNPVGRVWTKEELEKVGDLCLKYDVVLMDDEIHADFVYPGHTFTSFLALDEKYRKNLVLFTSPSKTFNIAGFQPSNIIAVNDELRAKFRTAKDESGYSNASLMGLVAVKAVYNKGDQWARELMDYITGNMEYMRDFVKENFPKATFVEPEGTYLTWVDFSGYGFTDEELDHLIVDEAKLWLDGGAIFGPETAQFERFNIACPRSTVEQAMNQLKAAIDSHVKWDA